MMRFGPPSTRSSTSYTLALLSAALLCFQLSVAPSVSAASAPDPASDPDKNIVGSLGAQHLTEAELIAADRADFDRLQNEYQRGQHQLQSKFAQAQHDLLQRQLDKLLDRRALELEAKARGIGTDALLAELKVPVVTDDEARAFYDANKDRITQSYEQVAPQIRQYLGTQRSDAATRAFYDDLRAKHSISSYLLPYRVAVAAVGPTRGPSNATVTIVEFADFQCPFCKQAESTLRTILSRYPQDVRLVFRNLPLTQLHPNARIAAEAGMCADRQGKFWEMHDVMYGDQHALSLDALKLTAQQLGLDAAQFSACVSDGAPDQVLDMDAKAALELGISSTPYFFINGRPLDGNVPAEKFEGIIGQELRRARSDRGNAVAIR